MEEKLKKIKELIEAWKQENERRDKMLDVNDIEFGAYARLREAIDELENILND